jgi:hypothetical protein
LEFKAILLGRCREPGEAAAVLVYLLLTRIRQMTH